MVAVLVELLRKPSSAGFHSRGIALLDACHPLALCLGAEWVLGLREGLG